MKKFLAISFVLNLVFIIQTFAVFPPPGSGPAPIDGGVAILAIAGAAYGISKLRKKDKEEV